MFHIPLDFLVIFTNRNYQVCLGVCRMHKQPKARHVCEQTADVFKGEIEYLTQSSASLPTTLPVFLQFPM